MLKTVTAFNLRKKALIYEEQQTKKSDLDASLSVFVFQFLIIVLCGLQKSH